MLDWLPDTRREWIAEANLIVAHDLEQLAVKHDELLAQDPAGDQQRTGRSSSLG